MASSIESDAQATGLSLLARGVLRKEQQTSLKEFIRLPFSVPNMCSRSVSFPSSTAKYGI